MPNPQDIKPKESARNRSRIEQAKAQKPGGGPIWPKVLAAFGIPIFGGMWVLYMLVTGQAHLDFSHFNNWVWKLALGATCIGTSVAMIWVRFGPGRENLNFLLRIGAPTIIFISALLGFYIVAPAWLTRPVDRFFFDVQDKTNQTIDDAKKKFDESRKKP